MDWFQIFITASIPSFATIVSALLVWKAAYQQLSQKSLIDRKSEWYKRYQDALKNAFAQESILERNHGISVIILLYESQLADFEDQELTSLSIDLLYTTLKE